MRRYLQGTLDFACGIYAVINALSVLYSLDLAGARKIFKETQLSLASAPAIWTAYNANETDHYWLVRYMLRRWCLDGPYALRFKQPFSDCLLPGDEDLNFAEAEHYLPERYAPDGPPSLAAAEKEAKEVWQELKKWLQGNSLPASSPAGQRSLPRAVLLRFHRFAPGLRHPVVSHWTAGKSLEHGVLQLHDASSEPGALLALEQKAMLPSRNGRALLRVVPESLLLLQTQRNAFFL